MPPERELAKAAAEVFSFTDRSLLALILMSLIGTLARALVGDEPLDRRKLGGEMLMALLAAVMLYAFGLMQGMTMAQMMFLGALSGLGGVRLLEWLIKIAKAARQST